MLDKPVPLTDAEMPCIIAFIQDDSPMGRYVKQCWGHDKLFMREYTICGINTDMAAKVGSQKTHPLSIHMFEIIGTFVKEGSDKWALYQMMQGNKVRHESFSMPKVHCAMNEKCQIAIFTTPSSMIDGGDVICHANDWLTSRQVGTIIDERTGWQIYEHEQPKPEPQYKVGDWVEIESSHVKGKTFVSVIKKMPNQEHYTVQVNSFFGGYTVYGIMERQIVRKLSPADIVIRIGCLSGTVRPASTNGIHIWFHLIGVDDKTIATIRISSLDTQTRELVESLIKGQEEE